jgi:hypothetical protein
MILEKIEIDKNTIVYKGIVGLFESFNREEFIKKIKYIQHLYPDFTNSMNEKSPGKQYPILVNLEETNFIINKVKTSLKNEINTPSECVINSWVYVSSNKNKYSGYHSHESTGVHQNNKTVMFDTSHTFTYYVQMPNNLKNDDGYLYFKTKDGKEFGFLPKEDEVWIFPGDLEHDVKTNTSSTNERIVIASNMHFFDYNDIKLEKSIL